MTQLADVGDGVWINKSGRFLTLEKARDLRCTFLQEGDVLVARMPAPLGRSCIFPGDPMPCVTVVDVCVIRPDRRKVDNRYLMHGINSPLGRNGIARHVTGTTRQRVSRKNLAKVELPLPPLAEQKRIAAILDAADALRAKRRESLAELDRLLQSTFLDLFGDPVTNPMGWGLDRIASIVVRKPNNGVFRKNHEYSEFRDEGKPVVWVEELFYGNEIDTSRSRRLKATSDEVERYGLTFGDILFCRSSLKLDGIAYNNVFLGGSNEALFECHLIRISPNLSIIDPVFLNQQLRTVPMRAVLKSKSKTATMTTIDQKALSSVEVIIPPLDLQRRFATIVESIERQKTRLRAHLTELDTLFASLQSRAFNGEL
nr:restriction endonuclease subunit S [Lamprobacter modestohalophilus]